MKVEVSELIHELEKQINALEEDLGWSNSEPTAAYLRGKKEAFLSCANHLRGLIFDESNNRKVS